MKHLPVKSLVLFYRDGTGNRYSLFGHPDQIRDAGSLEENSNLIAFFSNRSTPLVLNDHSKMYRTLFNRDTHGLLDRLGINLILPLHFREYHRGVVMARIDRKWLMAHESLAAILDRCAAIIIPPIEMERLELENDRNYYRLFKFDRLVLLGQMAASIAHELKTPMSTVLLELKELQDGELDSSESRMSFRKIHAELIRLNELIESLLSFSKFRPMQMDDVSLADLVRSSLDGIPGKRVPDGLRIETRLDEALISRVDRNRLHQVLLNILFNAFDAAGPGGLVSIRTYSEYREMKKHTRHIIAVSDNGPGIPQKHKNHVLEPFFTTKDNGTGLGLYISYGILTSMKGDLEIQSSGKGTTVFLILPGKIT